MQKIDKQNILFPSVFDLFLLHDIAVSVNNMKKNKEVKLFMSVTVSKGDTALPPVRPK